jgi:hypothetical protein
MTLALGALRADAAALLRVCDVFVNEPLDEWMRGDAKGRAAAETPEDADVGADADVAASQAVSAGSWCAPRARRAVCRWWQWARPTRAQVHIARTPLNMPLTPRALRRALAVSPARRAGPRARGCGSSSKS